ncbi:6-bladed beta-propeller [Algoriphagus sp. D3-2-R+10]|uniref:6-bladed beta-propeller n=1 Tax=Algoriphagus aurantiacus TaxID=3103948 RepID=UPI002B3C3CFB|nr:6-bladed beta-propeller [Algoriphagus sp. D3-2-R+10]MEB2774224.1 6-bladed beta-propeller [Algoriphagus sp. D3-2-R+10]
MRNSSIIFSSLFLFNILTSCSKATKKDDTSILTTTPFENAEEFHLSDFVDEQKYILLSTDEEALFKRVDKLIAKNDQFYLFDHLSQSGVLVFDSEGRFVQKIGEFGEGPQQLKGISDFQVDNNGDVQVLDRLNRSIVIYSPQGIWKEKVALPVNAGGFAQLGNNWFLAINYDHQNDELVNNQMLGVFDSTMEKDSLYFQYAEGAVSANVYYHAGLLSTGKNALIYHRPPNDTISIFSINGKLTDRLIIDFGANRLPDEVVNDFQTMSAYKAQDASFRYMQTPALLVGNHIFGIIASAKNEIWTYVYKLDSKELYSNKVNFSNIHLNELILPTANFNDEVVVSMIDPVTFSQDANPEAYPDEVRNHLENEGSVLLLHYLKP